MEADTLDEIGKPLVINRKDLLSTGSTLLNLACTGDPSGGFLCGKYYFLVGDSASGKTFLSMTCFAEATINPRFKQHRLIYDNIEDGMLMDLDTLFNEEVADRVEPPSRNGDTPVYSDTIESFYYHLDDAIDDGRPFIYVLDSMDALDSEAADKKFGLNKKAFRKKQARQRGEASEGEKEEKVAGSYGDGKAKKNSEGMRKAMKGLRKTGSILIVLSQTRDDIGAQYAGTKTRAGGRALRFYATTEIWSSVAMQLKKNVNDIERKVGVRVKLAVRKNRITGKLADVETDIYPSFGIDDLGTCVDYLVEEGWWPQPKQTINAKELGIEATRDKLIRVIEKRGAEKQVQAICGACWKAVDDACALKRKNRYQQET